MHYRTVLSTAATAAALFLTLTTAAPLNINLGAYSPAVVVGDGAIEFEEGGSVVDNLVNTLQGAAVSGAARVASASADAAPKVAQAQVVATTAAAADASSEAGSAPILSEPAKLHQPGDPKLVDRRRAIPAAIYDNSASEAQAQDQDQEDQETRNENRRRRRQLDGFDRALTFAEAALTKGPKVELGTGAEGSGVGMIVDNNAGGNAAAGAGAAPGAGSAGTPGTGIVIVAGH